MKILVEKLLSVLKRSRPIQGFDADWREHRQLIEEAEIALGRRRTIGDGVFRNGRPPHVGWWYTQYGSAQTKAWRWWNGQWWSGAIASGEKSIACINFAIGIQSMYGVNEIYWNRYWPKKARVPRVDPSRSES